MLTTAEGEIIFGISDFCQQLKQTVEQHFSYVWLIGEVSGFTHHPSGHMYFDIKDAQQKIACAFFRNRNRRYVNVLENGTQVILRGKVSIYGARSQYQLIVEHAEPYGQGDLKQAFDALKQKLSAAGLFDPASKKMLPSWPHNIGIITSENGAAIHDVLTVLKRRCPMIAITIYPVSVQGDNAVRTIIEAIKTANRQKRCDVLLMTRGGGSLEDLWAFNDEQLAHAIYQSKLPIVSAVGHEIDFTIADFVADQRAPTPSAAAELLSPDQLELHKQLEQYRQHLTHLFTTYIEKQAQQLALRQAKLKHPAQRLQERAQDCDHLSHRLLLAIGKQLEYQKQTYARHVSALQQLSPLNVLARGYAIAQKHNGEVITDCKQVKPGNQIDIRLKRGKLHCRVIKSLR